MDSGAEEWFKEIFVPLAAPIASSPGPHRSSGPKPSQRNRSFQPNMRDPCRLVYPAAFAICRLLILQQRSWRQMAGSETDSACVYPMPMDRFF